MRLESASDDLLQIEVEDDGVSWTRTDQILGSGLGTRFINAMSQSLHAELSYDGSANGTCAVLSFSPK